MCGAAPCASSASMSSHFSMTTKVSGPYCAWIGGAGSASTAGAYSIQPFSASTAGMLARKCVSTSSRLPGLVVRTAMTWIMVPYTRPMWIPTARVLVAVLLGLSLSSGADCSTAPDDVVRVRLDQSLAPHPRLLLTQARLDEVKRAIAADPTVDAVWQAARAQADRALDAPALERRVEGRRLLGVSRECLSRVMHLAFAFRMTGERKYLDSAVRQMLTVAAFEDWNPSHFLDVAEMTA